MVLVTSPTFRLRTGHPSAFGCGAFPGTDARGTPIWCPPHCNDANGPTYGVEMVKAFEAALPEAL